MTPGWSSLDEKILSKHPTHTGWPQGPKTQKRSTTRAQMSHSPVKINCETKQGERMHIGQRKIGIPRRDLTAYNPRGNDSTSREQLHTHKIFQCRCHCNILPMPMSLEHSSAGVTGTNRIMAPIKLAPWLPTISPCRCNTKHPSNHRNHSKLPRILEIV